MQSVAVLEEDVRDRVRGSAVVTSKESSRKEKNVMFYYNVFDFVFPCALSYNLLL